MAIVDLLLVSTRIGSGRIVMTPLYAIAVMLSFIASRFTTVTTSWGNHLVCTTTTSRRS